MRWWHPDDLEALANFKLGPHSFGAAAVLREAARVLGTSDSAIGCYVAVEDGTSRLVGAIVFTAEGGKEALINAVGVVPERRRQRIGTALKEQAIDYFAYIGALTYRSEVDRFNQGMQELNEKMFGLVGIPDGKDIHYAAKVDPRLDGAGPAGTGARPKLVTTSGVSSRLPTPETSSCYRNGARGGKPPALAEGMQSPAGP